MKTRKSLGQHFLKNKRILRKIVFAGDFRSGETVIEIGSGSGSLTQELLKARVKIIAVEKDANLCYLLEQKFADQENFQLICGDVLKFEPEKYVKANQYKIIGNIPYYLTGKILELVLEKWPRPEKIVLTVQKQVGEKLTARPSKLSVLGTINQLLAEIKILFSISRAEFFPKPKVDSCLIEITPYQKNLFRQHPELKQFIKLGFSQPRKYLISVLANKLGKDKDLIGQKFLQLGLEPTRRAGELTPETWLELFKSLID
ncbi:MAG: 16S rRNA (adenine(1518)-N(6)/adenine(1519)-N(6))-dimethyltransferase RsmA [Patescibacteria group bacterium]